MSQNLPIVTVIIPARNEENVILRCLEALERNDYPHDRMETLLVDGMSEDRTRELAQQFQSNGWPLRILSNHDRSRAAGLNLGVKEAHGEVILRLDARSLIPPNYVRRCVDTLLATGADNVGGIQKPIATTPTQEAIGLAMSTPFGVGNAQFRLGKKSGFVDTVYLGCFRREVFARVGRFDDDAAVISEDSDMNQRIRESGGKVYLDAGIEAYYYPRERVQDLGRLYFRYGGARMGNILKHGKPTAWRQLVPPGFAMTLGALLVGSLFHAWFRVALLAVLALYLVCDVAFSGSLARKKFSLFPRLLLAFPCMHFAYAFGFFYRLLQRPKPGSEWGY